MITEKPKATDLTFRGRRNSLPAEFVGALGLSTQPRMGADRATEGRQEGDRRATGGRETRGKLSGKPKRAGQGSCHEVDLVAPLVRIDAVCINQSDAKEKSVPGRHDEGYLRVSPDCHFLAW
jgi:hypothetical protein